MNEILAYAHLNEITGDKVVSFVLIVLVVAIVLGALGGLLFVCLTYLSESYETSVRAKGREPYGF